MQVPTNGEVVLGRAFHFELIIEHCVHKGSDPVVPKGMLPVHFLQAGWHIPVHVGVEQIYPARQSVSKLEVAEQAVADDPRLLLDVGDVTGTK